MTRLKKSVRVAEYGDFQTPADLAIQVCELLRRQNLRPASMVEPTCGEGSFLIHGVGQFPSVERAVGIEINPDYVRTVKSRLRSSPHARKVQVIEGDFFSTDWFGLLRNLADPLLVIGNPPWVTNTELGGLGSSNLPKKSNFKRHSGLDALTGKSNFDISEWMLLQFLHWLEGRHGTLAMLCKTVVARKVLEYAWSRQVNLEGSEVYSIDAKTSFGASVDACLLVGSFSPGAQSCDSVVFESLAAEGPVGGIGYRDGHLVADVGAYERWKHLQGSGTWRWRSGIKHDCAKVMELYKEDKRYRNGFDELADLEDDHVYPMFKSSEIAKGAAENPSRWMLVTQRRVGEDTRTIQRRSPKTWEYLDAHADRLSRRASSIYRNRPPFSIFGVGEYSFSPWKVAISGLYKKLEFSVVGGHAR
jgi:hypothetical protein